MRDDDLPTLDRVFEHGVRLGIAVLLARYDEISFRRFKELLQQTDGSLGAQLRKLEDTGYVSVRKEFRDRRPVTWYALSAKGRKALRAHLDALQTLIRSAGRS
jgi:DNA-binding MarR family transcriptional regulator